MRLTCLILFALAAIVPELPVKANAHEDGPLRGLPYRIYPLTLGFEKDIKLGLMNTAGVTPRELCQRLVLVRNNKKVLLHSLNQLQGLVHIENEGDAIRFVRLRTSLAIWHAWDTPGKGVEVISQKEIMTIPNFGIENQWVNWSSEYSGKLGVLSNEDYRKGGFTPLSVRHVSKGYIVTRWVFWAHFEPERDDRQTYSVQRISEYVGTDGLYKSKVINRRVRTGNIYDPFPPFHFPYPFS